MEHEPETISDDALNLLLARSMIAQELAAGWTLDELGQTTFCAWPLGRLGLLAQVLAVPFSEATYPRLRAIYLAEVDAQRASLPTQAPDLEIGAEPVSVPHVVYAGRVLALALALVAEVLPEGAEDVIITTLTELEPEHGDTLTTLRRLAGAAR